MTSTAIKFKCKSWIDTFGQRGSKAAGSIITNAFADSLVGLVNYGTLVGVFIGGFTLWVANFMGKQFEELHKNGEKVGDEMLVRYEEVEGKNIDGDGNSNSSSSCVDDDDGDDNENINTSSRKLKQSPMRGTTII